MNVFDRVNMVIVPDKRPLFAPLALLFKVSIRAHKQKPAAMTRNATARATLVR